MVSPFTVIWYCVPERAVVVSRVVAFDATHAVLTAANEHAEAATSADVRLLMVFRGHLKPEMIEVDDRFSFFGEKDAERNAAGEITPSVPKLDS